MTDWLTLPYLAYIIHYILHTNKEYFLFYYSFFPMTWKKSLKRLYICIFHSRMSLKSFRFLDSPLCISCQWARLCMKCERANLAHTWRANWSDLSWLSLGTGEEGEMGKEVINMQEEMCKNNSLKFLKKRIFTLPPLKKKILQTQFLLPSSCAMLCLWLTEALFHTASRTRLPNLEQAIWTYWPWEDRR